jgi:hypothetical protein
MRKTLLVLSFTPVFLLALVAQHAFACCLDDDQDGYGIDFLDECTFPNQFDCDDTNPEINPGATEAAFGDPVCGDGVDNDCDGSIDMLDEGCFECTVPQDCDDGNPCTDDLCVENICGNVNNTAPCDDGDTCTVDDVCANGTCSGAPADADEDGYTSDQCGGNDCDDSDAAINPGATEAPFGDPICADQVDNDCDDLVDLLDNGCQECTVPGDCDDANPCTEDDCVANECVHVDNSDLDGDTFPSDLCGGTDCDDSDPAVYPGTWEGPAGDPTCTDGADNNCNGYMDLDEAGCAQGAGWSLGEEADAAVYSAPSREGSKRSNALFAFLLPIGAVVLLRRIFRKR